jgi:hypothetical protein
LPALYHGPTEKPPKTDDLLNVAKALSVQVATQALRHRWSDGQLPADLALRMPLREKRSSILCSNSVSDLGGAKRARTANLLHAMPTEFVRRSSRTSGTRTSGHMRCLAESGTGRKSLGA